ncbi:TAFII28-domain-containing protein [Armillaria borealis]|uniref:TAFII28-domain-containing protein n=1 Tax=Armillaria borealis TaxID=47425 RepID=A0AA39K6A8_9AGAR|nr:TAFII28-domain-containing protein [Armillaria borealis]
MSKRGRKPAMGNSPTPGTPFSTTPQFHQVHWALPAQNSERSSVLQGDITSNRRATTSTVTVPQPSASPTDHYQRSFSATPSSSSVPVLDTTGLIALPGEESEDSTTVVPAPVIPAAASTSAITTVIQPQPIQLPVPAAKAPVEEDGEGDDEMLPAMADDDYSAQLSFQSQSKDNLKVLMDNFSPDQYDRFEAYRRHALPKQAVRKVALNQLSLSLGPCSDIIQVIQQTVGQQVSQPVAQIVAGFAKVFVGEVVEKARAVQARRGETGPLSPDHLREAYRLYQEETGRVGAARPVRSKRLFVR